MNSSEKHTTFALFLRKALSWYKTLIRSSWICPDICSNPLILKRLTSSQRHTRCLKNRSYSSYQCLFLTKALKSVKSEKIRQTKKHPQATLFKDKICWRISLCYSRARHESLPLLTFWSNCFNPPLKSNSRVNLDHLVTFCKQLLW
jgi:hypothetical protein